MGDPVTPTAPQLPPDAPADLRDFIECKSASVTLKDGKLTWLPLPPEIKDFVPDGAKPDMSISPGGTPGTATIKVGLGPINITLPASVSGGQLNVDTSDPGMLTPQPLVDGINKAVKDLNDWFKHNGKGFGKVTFGNGVTLTKVDLAPPGGAKPPPPPPPPPPPATPPTPPLSPGCLGILFLVLAIFGVGAILFFGGPALGLFGQANPTQTATASPTATATATATATPTPVPTASPTPAPLTVMSDDGLVKLTIPDGSVPAGANLTVTAKGQADAPPELAGLNFRSAFYRLEPSTFALTGSITMERTIDLTAIGVDPERTGYPVSGLALRTVDARWTWLADQRSMVGGADGTAPETRIQQTATLNGLGDVFGFATLYVRPDPYPEMGSTLEVGRSVDFGIVVSGQGGAGLPRAARPRLSAITWFASQPDLVTFGSTFTTVANGVESAVAPFTCRAPGDLVVGGTATIDPQVASDLLTRLGLGTQPTDQFTFATSIHCGGQTSGFQPVLEAGCVSVIHQPFQIYPSYLHWLFGFAADPAFPSSATLDLSYREGDSGPLLTFSGFPIVDGKATADTGITRFGEKHIVGAHVKWSDGISEQLTDVITSSVFGTGMLVTSVEGVLVGNACQ